MPHMRSVGLLSKILYVLIISSLSYTGYTFRFYLRLGWLWNSTYPLGCLTGKQFTSTGMKMPGIPGPYICRSSAVRLLNSLSVESLSRCQLHKHSLTQIRLSRTIRLNPNFNRRWEQCSTYMSPTDCRLYAFDGATWVSWLLERIKRLTHLDIRSGDPIAESAIFKTLEVGPSPVSYESFQNSWVISDPLIDCYKLDQYLQIHLPHWPQQKVIR